MKNNNNTNLKTSSCGACPQNADLQNEQNLTNKNINANKLNKFIGQSKKVLIIPSLPPFPIDN